MFGGLFNSRLKAAELALKEARLDEAFRLATQPDLKGHRRSAAVRAAPTEKFLERARAAYREDRFSDALIDLDRAEAGGVLKDQIAELRQYVQTVATEHCRKEDSRRGRLEAAVKRIEDGSLDAGRQILQRVAANDEGAAALDRKMAERAKDLQTIVEQAERLMASGQLAAAVERVRKARFIDGHHPDVTRVVTTLCERILQNARTALVQGKLARSADELACLGDLGSKLPMRKEVGDWLAMARDAASCAAGYRYGEARRHLLSLSRQAPDAKWIAAALEQLRILDETHTALCAGALGDRIGDHANRDFRAARTSARAEARGSLDDTVALPDRVRAELDTPERLLLLVDGGGSYLVLRGGRASLGRAASESPADVPVFSDVAERHANIHRVDDDYFVFGAKEIEVGGRLVQHQLLRDSDKVVLGRKAKFTFRLPSRKSPSAVLELSDTTKMPNDVRRVILFHQHATLGQGPTAHILCRHAGTPLVLFERGGGLWIRQQSDGHVDTAARQLAIGEPVEIGGVSLVLQRWKVSGRSVA